MTIDEFIMKKKQEEERKRISYQRKLNEMKRYFNTDTLILDLPGEIVSGKNTIFSEVNI